MLTRSQVNRRIERAMQANHDERTRSPQIVQRGKAVRHRGTSAAGVFAEVTATLTHDLVDSYTVQRINPSGTKDGVDIEIDRAMGYEGRGADGVDLRNYAPWFQVGAIVPIIQHYDATAAAQKWFIDLPLLFIGPAADRSLDVDEDDNHRTMAVWK